MTREKKPTIESWKKNATKKKEHKPRDKCKLALVAGANKWFTTYSETNQQQYVFAKN